MSRLGKGIVAGACVLGAWAGVVVLVVAERIAADRKAAR